MSNEYTKVEWSGSPIEKHRVPVSSLFSQSGWNVYFGLVVAAAAVKLSDFAQLFELEKTRKCWTRSSTYTLIQADIIQINMICLESSVIIDFVIVTVWKTKRIRPQMLRSGLYWTHRFIAG